MDIRNLQNLQKVLDDAVESKKVAGLNLAVVQNGKEIGYWQSGFSDVENKKEFNRDTICRLFSMTKPVTSVAAWKLIEQGKIELCDEVGKFIEEFKDLKVCTDGKNVNNSFRKITIQDLLNMTSGYTYGAWNNEAPLGEQMTSSLINELNEDCMKKCQITTVDVAKRLAKIPVSFEPGTDYAYGLSADILGAVIETVSQMKFSDYLDKYIFKPLDMKDTGFYVKQENYHRLSNMYTCDDEKNVIKFENPNLGIQPFMNHEPSFESGGAGLCSTIDDYLKFLQMLVNKGEYNGKRILQEKTVDFFTAARLRDNLQEKFNWKMEHLSGYTYCNLFRVAFEKGKCRAITEDGEFGWDGWLGPYMSVDIKNNLVIVMMMQKTNSGTWEVTRKVKNIIYTSL